MDSYLYFIFQNTDFQKPPNELSLKTLKVYTIIYSLIEPLTFRIFFHSE